jgi:hypothetical protein
MSRLDQRLKTESEFKDYILRQMGSKQWQIELDDENWNDILTVSTRFFYETSDIGWSEQIVLLKRDDFINDEITLSRDVLDVKTVMGRNLYAPSDLINIQTILQMSTVNTLILNTSTANTALGGMTAFVVGRKYMSLMRDLMSNTIHFRWTYESRKLKLLSNANPVVLVLDVADPIENMYDSEYLRIVTLKYALQMWVDNLGLKYDLENASIMNNGMKLNVRGIQDRVTKLEEEIKKGIQDARWSTYVPYKRLYD